MKKRLLIGIVGILLGLGLAMTAQAQTPVEDQNMPPGGDFILPCPGPGPCQGLGPGLGPNAKAGRNQGRNGMRNPPQETMGQGMGMGRHEEMHHHYLERIREQDPKRYQRMVKIQELAGDYRAANDPAKKQQIEKELRPLLEQELKAQQADAKERVTRMEKRLADIKNTIKQRDEHWNEVVDFNFKKITGQVDYLEFPTPPAGAPEPSPREPQK